MNKTARFNNIKIIEEGNTITQEAIRAVLRNFRRQNPQDIRTDEQLTPKAIKILFEHRRLSKLN